jgi:8-oxo-dGTP pyrophosphatase MutT (NUDIX family)
MLLSFVANIELRQVLMMRRGPTAKFMPNSFVFPGGLLELDTDSNFPVEKTNFANVAYEPIRMQGYDNDFPFRVAAVRELFEETGILLVENENTRESLLVTHEDDKSLADWRIKVVIVCLLGCNIAFSRLAKIPSFLKNYLRVLIN